MSFVSAVENVPTKAWQIFFVQYCIVLSSMKTSSIMPSCFDRRRQDLRKEFGKLPRV